MSTPFSVVGTIATEPRLIDTSSQIPMCTFRVASTERRFDRENNTWGDGETNWFTVTAFRSLATHARDSFAKGDRVIVTGRLRVRHWEANERSGVTVEIDADALGHDLRWGTSKFQKDRSAMSAADPAPESTTDAPADSSAPKQPASDLSHWNTSAVVASTSSAELDAEASSRSSDGFTPAVA